MRLALVAADFFTPVSRQLPFPISQPNGFTLHGGFAMGRGWRAMAYVSEDGFKD